MDEVFLNLDVYSVSNILDEDITITFGGNPFPFKAGETKLYPKQVAEFLANKIVDRLIEKEVGFEYVISPSARNERLPKILKASEVNTPKIKTPEEQTNEFINQVNQAPTPNTVVADVMANTLNSLPDTTEEEGFEGINDGVSK